MVPEDVAVVHHHLHRLVAADLLDGRNVSAGHDEAANAGVPHDVGRAMAGIQPRMVLTFLRVVVRPVRGVSALRRAVRYVTQQC